MTIPKLYVVYDGGDYPAMMFDYDKALLQLAEACGFGTTDIPEMCVYEPLVGAGRYVHIETLIFQDLARYMVDLGITVEMAKNTPGVLQGALVDVLQTPR